jgi:SHS2 domain-containing protein
MDEDRESTGGHRAVPHTADLRIEAWGPTREECIAEAVAGAVESFVDVSGAHAAHELTRHVDAHSDDDLLAAVLDEVVYLLDTTGEVPVDVELQAAGDGVDLGLAMVAAAALPRTGAVPKAVSLHELALAHGPRGWWCSVTLDV